MTGAAQRFVSMRVRQPVRSRWQRLRHALWWRKFAQEHDLKDKRGAR